MLTVLNYVAKKERFDLPSEAATEIIEDSQGNMRKALLVLEALKTQSYVNGISVCLWLALTMLHSPDLSSNLTIAKPDWETYCMKVADLIVKEQSPAKVLEIRTKLYELLAHCIPPTTIIKVSFEMLPRHITQLVSNIPIVWSDHRLLRGGSYGRGYQSGHNALGRDLRE